MTESLIAFAIILILSFIGFPLAYATLAVGFFGFWYIRGDLTGAITLSGQELFDFSTLFGLSLVPLFILMGTLIQRANISDELYEAGYAWVGKFKGGLAMATILSCAGFSAVSGSSLATAATMSRVAMPPMRRYKYRDSLAAGTLAAGGTLGILLLIVPVFLPSLEAVADSSGMDPTLYMIWFGIVVIIVVELGLITPPIGINVFTVKSVIPDVQLTKIFIGVIPFVFADLFVLGLMFLVPGLAIFLPSLM